MAAAPAADPERGDSHLNQSFTPALAGAGTGGYPRSQNA